MSSNPYSDNPYSPEGAKTIATSPVRPGGVTVVAVVAIVLGIMGLAGGCIGAGALIVGPYLQSAMQPGPGATAAETMQYELQQEMQTITDQYFIPQVAMQVTLLIIAGCLTIGGIQVLRLRPSGRAFLLYTFLALIVFEVIRTALQAIIQLQMLPVVEEGMNRALREAAGRPAEAMLKWVAQMTYAVVIFTLVVVMAWALIKIVIYGLSARYLSKPEIIRLFEASK